MDSRKRGGKYIGHKYIYKAFHNLRIQVEMKMEKDIIYFFLSSIDSLKYHPNNKAYIFTVEVPERSSLTGDWEIGICDFYAGTVTNETLYYS